MDRLPDNPLTARVMVNRIWQHHFGRGIVADAEQLRPPGTPAVASRAARLAGHRVRAPRLEHQADAPADHDLARPTRWRRHSRGRRTWRRIPTTLISGAFRCGAWKARSIRDIDLSASGKLNLEGRRPSVFPARSRPRCCRVACQASGCSTKEGPDLAAQRLLLLEARHEVSDVRSVRSAGHEGDLRAPQQSPRCRRRR